MIRRLFTVAAANLPLLCVATISLPLCGAIGCSRPPQTTVTAPLSAASWTAPLTPGQVARWSPQEAKAVLIAWAALQCRYKQIGARAPDVMDFQIHASPKGWEVHVQLAGGYVDGKAIGAPGYFEVVEIGADWKVIRIVGGA